MKILVGCESSGAVRRAFRDRGHDAWSCDILEADDGSPFHLRCDVLSILGDGWDMGLFYPPCTFLCVSGLHWNGRRPGRAAETERALEFVGALLSAPIDRVSLENPVGCISTRIRKPDQIIQPHQFGEDASKATCLWLRNLPPLVPTEHIAPRIFNGKPRWANQTDSGQNKLPPTADRWKLRSETYAGIAAAKAKQWGDL